MTIDPAEVTALALWVGLLVAYLRRLIGTLAGRDRLPGEFGPPLAMLVAECITLGGWWLGLRAGSWQQAVVTGFQAALAAMGGYSGLKQLVESSENGGHGIVPSAG